MSIFFKLFYRFRAIRVKPQSVFKFGLCMYHIKCMLMFMCVYLFCCCCYGIQKLILENILKCSGLA